MIESFICLFIHSFLHPSTAQKTQPLPSEVPIIFLEYLDKEMGAPYNPSPHTSQQYRIPLVMSFIWRHISHFSFKKPQLLGFAPPHWPHLVRDFYHFLCELTISPQIFLPIFKKFIPPAPTSVRTPNSYIQ